MHFSVTQIHHIIFFQALLLLFFTFQYFLRKKKSLLALSLATSFFFPLLFLLPRIQLPLNMVLLYCFLSFFFFSWEEMLTQKWQRMKSKMMLLIHLLLFLPCRSRHLSFWKKTVRHWSLGIDFYLKTSYVEYRNEKL